LWLLYIAQLAGEKQQHAVAANSAQAATGVQLTQKQQQHQQ
jgi:hypothetical protein